MIGTKELTMICEELNIIPDGIRHYHELPEIEEIPKLKMTGKQKDDAIRAKRIELLSRVIALTYDPDLIKRATDDIAELSGNIFDEIVKGGGNKDGGFKSWLKKVGQKIKSFNLPDLIHGKIKAYHIETSATTYTINGRYFKVDKDGEATIKASIRRKVAVIKNVKAIAVK